MTLKVALHSRHMPKHIFFDMNRALFQSSFPTFLVLTEFLTLFLETGPTRTWQTVFGQYYDWPKVPELFGKWHECPKLDLKVFKKHFFFHTE